MNESVENEEEILASLKIKELEIKKDRTIKITKIITTAAVVTGLPALINMQIQDQTLEIKRLEGEVSYLQKFAPEVVQENDLLKRRFYVEYLSTVAHSKGSRQRWGAYLKLVDTQIARKNEADKILEKKFGNVESIVDKNGLVNEKFTIAATERSDIIHAL